MLRTKWQLAQALFALGCNGATVRVLRRADQQEVEGVLQSVMRESGDGKCFILVIYVGNGKTEKVFWHSED